MVDQPHDMRNRIGPVAAQIRRRRAEDPLDLALRRLGGRSSIGPIKRCTIIGLTALTTIIVVAAVAVALFAARLTQGPISISDLGPRIAAALDQKVGPGYSFSVGATSITGSLRGLALSIDGLALRDMTGRPLVVAPKAEVSLDPLALLRGNVMPKRLQILDVDVRLSVLPDGSMAVSAGSDPILLPATPVSTSGAAATADVSQLASAAPQSAVQPVADAVSHVLDVVTAPDSPLSALERVGIAHGSLVFDDRTLNETTTYSNFELTYRKADDKLDFKVAADGASGRWQIGAKAQGAVGSGRSVDFNLDNVSLDQIVLFGGVRNLGFDFDMPISTKLHFGIDPAGHLAQASGQFSFGSGYFYTSNPDAEPMLVDSLVGGFHWDAVNQQIVIDPTQFSSGKSHFEIKSTLTAPQDGSDGWRVEAETSPGGVVGPERPGETPVAVDAHVAGRLFVAERRFAVERFALSGPQVDFSMSGTLAWGSEAQTHIKLAATAGKMPMRAVVRLWPSFISAPVHAWFLQHLLDGTLDKGAIAVDFSGADLTAMREHLPIPAESVNLDFSLANASTSFLPGVPPLSNLTGNGHVTGRTVDFAATGGVLDDGGGRILTLADGTFHVADTSLKPTPTVIKAHVLGGLDAVADFLSHDALKSVGTTMPIDTATVKGQVDAQLAIDLKIDKVVLPADISIGARATVNDFSVDKIIAKEKLDQAVLNVVFDNSVLHAQGSGRLFGAPASIELTKPASGSTVAEVSARLDDAARARLGWSLGPALVGSIGAHFVSALGQGDTVHSQVDLDLTHADIENLLPGYVKPAGRPAKVSFGVTTDGQGIVLDPVVFDGGTSSARGSLQFDSAGGFVAAHLSSLRLSPGDDMKVEASQAKNVMKLVVRGATVDVRPFLNLARNFDSGTRSDVGRPHVADKDLDLDFRSTLVTGENKQSMTGVELRLSRRDGKVTQFNLAGRLGREAVNGSLASARDGGPAQIRLAAADAGALLSFTDIYRRMEGGSLQLVASLGEGRVDGQVSVRNFILHDEPAIRRLVTEGVSKREEQNGTTTIKVDPTAARFTKLTAGFARTGSRLEIHDGDMYSPEIGTKLDGWLDFARNQVDMSGTFVPIYGFNNLFSQIPLFGPILGGDQHEGLFALDFRITGPASAPVLNVNPLSIAPGILRKIFGAIGPGDSQAAPPPDSNAPLSLAPVQ